jgi:hypothetical protein
MIYKLKQTDLVYSSDEFGHSYEIEGEAIAGVTTILSLGVPADQGLIAFWKQMSAEDQADILSDAQDRGSNVHQAIEQLLLGRKVKSEDLKRPREKAGITAFVDWFEKIKPTYVRPETVVAYLGTEEEGTAGMKYAGTVDLVCTINDRRILIDFKTSATPSKKNSLQAQAYKKAVEQSLGETIDDCYILYLGTKHTGTRPKLVDDMPNTGFGWSMIKSEDTFNDFHRAYDMAIWCSGGYPKPPKVLVYPKEWNINNKE